MRRRRRRFATSGNSPLQVIAVVSILGVAVAAALVAAGGDMHRAYRENRKLLASPYP